MALGDIPLALRNPKIHAPALADSIKRFSFADAPILDERTGRLVAGHGRLEQLEAMRDAGQSAPEGVVVKAAGDWTVPVQRGWSSRSDEDAEAFVIAHNRLTELGGFDDRVLTEMLQEFADADPDLLPATGFDPNDLNRLLILMDLDREAGENDPFEEFKSAGIDDFANDDLKAAYSVRVNFLTMDDYTEFRDLLGLVGVARNRLWFPEQPDLVESGIEHVPETEPAAD